MPLSPASSGGDGESPDASRPEPRYWVDDPDPRARRLAARQLGEQPGSSPELASRLAVESVPEVREALLAALVCQGDEPAARALIQCLHAREPALRNGAVEALQQMPEAFAHHGRGLLDDSDPRIRQRAVEIMRDLHHSDVPHWLLDLLPVETDPNVCVAAVDALAEVGDSRAGPVVEEVMERFIGEPVVELAAGEALWRLRGAE